MLHLAYTVQFFTASHIIKSDEMSIVCTQNSVGLTFFGYFYLPNWEIIVLILWFNIRSLYLTSTLRLSIPFDSSKPVFLSKPSAKLGGKSMPRSP